MLQCRRSPVNYTYTERASFRDNTVFQERNGNSKTYKASMRETERKGGGFHVAAEHTRYTLKPNTTGKAVVLAMKKNT